MLRRATIVLMLLAAGLAGCATYSSGPFTPPAKTDQETFGKARKDVYPRDVREHPERYRDDSIAWAGIVKNVEVFRSRVGPSVKVLVEHRYFDWIEDHGAQPELFFLSPRGEGDFMIVLKPEGEMTSEEASRLIPAGTMVVAVGKVYMPSAADRRFPLALLTEYRQFIGAKWYRTDVFDYGRAGEPIRRVEGGAFWKEYGPH